MLIKLLFAELHNPLFLAGTNLKQKLYAADLEMIFDLKQDKLLVRHKGQIAIIPANNISSMTPLDPKAFDKAFEGVEIQPRSKTHISHASTLNIKHAQVSDPATTVQNPPRG